VVGAFPSEGDGVTRPSSRFSHATKVVVALAALLAVVAATGILSSERSIRIRSDRAVEIAEAAVEFEPELIRVRLVRQGFRSAPYWAVSLSVPETDGVSGRVATVLVSATDGSIAEIATS
jgi:hypothetical protein